MVQLSEDQKAQVERGALVVEEVDYIKGEVRLRTTEEIANEQERSAEEYRQEQERLASRIIAIRTSDRILFRRCRRKWGWASPLKQSRKASEPAEYFWFGTGMHYALEDFHGQNYYKHPAQAFSAYTQACTDARKNGKNIYVPDLWQDLDILGQGMMAYYADFWLRNRPTLQTYVDPRTGRYQTEVRCQVPLPIKGPHGETVVYDATLDRVLVDEIGELAICDYKSAKAYQLGHLEIDEQITSYMWVGTCLYERPIGRFLYQQHKKRIPSVPRILSKGTLSIDKKQGTVAALYNDLLMDMYGSFACVPPDNTNFLNWLYERETEDGDPFVKRDWVTRNPHQLAAQGEKIMMEVEEMLREDLPLYPNPTKDCGWDCAFQPACIALDDGSDHVDMLDQLTVIRNRQEEDTWRTFLPQTPPARLKGLPQLEGMQQILELLEEKESPETEQAT